MLKRPPMVSSSRDLSLEMLYNTDTLNLFSDASTTSAYGRKAQITACFGSVAVCCDRIIAEEYRVESSTTVPAAELRGIIASLSIALLYRNNFKVINIFSDSQIALRGLRDYIYNWEYQPKKDRFINTSNSAVKNQELYIEAFALLQNLRQTNIVNLFHQKGHVDSGWNEVNRACNLFKSINGIQGNISLPVITYISTFNNYVDNKTRTVLHQTDLSNYYQDAIEYLPMGGQLYERV